MLVHDMSPPVILSWERLAPLSGVRAIRLRAVKFLGLVVLVVDVTIEMGLGAKSHDAARMWALVWSIMIALMVTTRLVSNAISNAK